MKKKIDIEGMSCMHCVKRVQNALKEIDGVAEATVDLSDKSAVISFEKEVTDELLKNAVTEAGYDVIKVETV